MENELILFETADKEIKLTVPIKNNTVWLNRKQLAELFGRDVKTIGKHINNALKEELDNSVVANFATTASDGKVYQVEHYNLDMIISIGYRVKSNRGVEFRKWANSVLKQYIIQGYAINGINRDMGYEVRYRFAEISIAVITISLAILLIWGIVSMYRHNCQALSIQPGKNRVALIIIFGAAAIFTLLIIGMSGLSVVFGMDGAETVTGHDSKYTYITVQEDYGGERRYRTNNPFIMQSMDGLWWSSEIMDVEEDNEESSDADTEDSPVTEDTQNGDVVEDYEAEGQHDGLTIQNAMLAVYNYLQENNALQNMAFSYTANAKGEIYGVVSETQETKDGNTVNVKYCLYDNGAKTDADGNSCEELVLEKVYPDGNYETELVDFYLVNTYTMQVTDEQKNTW